MTELPKSVRDRLAAHPSDGVAAGEHPDADLLTAFAEQALSANERERVITHLAQCAACRRVMSLATPPIEAVPANVASRRSWFAMQVLLRWGAVLAAAVVVMAAVLLRRPAFQVSRSDGESAQVATLPAITRPEELTTATDNQWSTHDAGRSWVKGIE